MNHSYPSQPGRSQRLELTNVICNSENQEKIVFDTTENPFMMQIQKARNRGSFLLHLNKEHLQKNLPLTSTQKLHLQLTPHLKVTDNDCQMLSPGTRQGCLFSLPILRMGLGSLARAIMKEKEGNDIQIRKLKNCPYLR